LNARARHERGAWKKCSKADERVSTLTFALLAVGMQGLFVLLDLAEWRRKDRRDAPPPEGAGAWLFLLACIGVFFALQAAGYALVPKTHEIFVSLRASVARWFHQNPAEAPMGWPAAILVSIVAFYISGLWDYLVHRFFSHHGWFFFTHEYHHLPRQVTCVMPGIAGRPFAVFAVFPTLVASITTLYGLLALGGLPLWDLSTLKVLFLAILAVQVVSHSSFMRRQKWVHDILNPLAITSPQEHVLHHSVDLQGNYGNFTSLWDRLFGTYLDPRLPQHRGHSCGLSYGQDFLGTITLGRLKLPRAWRRRFQVERFCNMNETKHGKDWL
jgi:sterol desaturase/sphingolipid hydroxylase (fatty acid hydroxylase superfamily)